MAKHFTRQLKVENEEDKKDWITVSSIADYYDGNGPYTIDLNNTYGTTTTYWAGDSVTDITIGGNNDGTITLDIGSLTSDTIDIDWDKVGSRITLEPTMWEDCMPDPQKLKKMCEQYPALAKVYENFKTVYSMVEQDWKGNHDDEDELPF